MSKIDEKHVSRNLHSFCTFSYFYVFRIHLHLNIQKEHNHTNRSHYYDLYYPKSVSAITSLHIIIFIYTMSLVFYSKLCNYFNNKRVKFISLRPITMWRSIIFNCAVGFVIILSPTSNVSTFIIVLNFTSHPNGFLGLFILGCGHDSYINVYRSPSSFRLLLERLEPLKVRIYSPKGLFTN